MEKLAIVCMIFVIGLISCEQQEESVHQVEIEMKGNTSKRQKPAEILQAFVVLM